VVGGCDELLVTRLSAMGLACIFLSHVCVFGVAHTATSRRSKQQWTTMPRREEVHVRRGHERLQTDDEVDWDHQQDGRQQ